MRKRYPSTLKAQVVLEILQEEKSISQIASEHGIHQSQLNRWRKQAVENLPQVFSSGENIETLRKEYENREQKLYSEIGRLTTELRWLKKKGGWSE